MGCSQSSSTAELLSKNTIVPFSIEVYLKGESLELTIEQIELVQSSWKLIDNPRDLGLDIMTRLFTNHKEVKSRWIFAKHLETIEEIQTNPQVLYHAFKIAGVFNRIVNNLKNTNFNDQLKSLVNLGKSHYNYDVKQYDYKDLEEAVLYCLENRFSKEINFSTEMKMAWKKFYWMIATKMCEGMKLAEQQDQNRNKEIKLQILKI